MANKKHTDFSNVTKMKNELIPEEFPEGAFGSPIHAEKPVQSKTTPWEKGQRRKSAFVYSNKDLHDDLPRQAPGAHPIHDDDNQQQEE